MTRHACTATFQRAMIGYLLTYGPDLIHNPHLVDKCKGDITKIVNLHMVRLASELLWHASTWHILIAVRTLIIINAACQPSRNPIISRSPSSGFASVNPLYHPKAQKNLSHRMN